MADHNIVRGRTGLALILALLLMVAGACKSTSDSSSGSGSSGSSGGSGGTSAVASTGAAAPGTTSTAAAEKVCGTPPCVRYVSRGATKTLAGTLTDHPILSTVALHAAVTVLCGGILCLLGEGVSLAYVDHAAKDAASQHACLKVSILPDNDKWKLMNLSASNQSPYCTD